jgi:prephenate dehydrogenase
MGASLAAACRKKFPRARVIGISRNPKALHLSLQKKWVHEATSDLRKGISPADLVILCTPLDTFRNLLKKIDQNAKPGTVVTDVGSVKGEIGAWASKRRFKNIRFVGAHPMVGSHERGVSAARADLYDHGFTLVIRSNETNAGSFQKTKSFWQTISPRVFEMSARQHDKITGEISHLPHAVAVCLMLSAAEDSLGFAASGFADTTRIAQGHPSIWVPIFRANHQAVLSALKIFENRLRVFKKALRGKGSELEAILSRAARKRSQISL